MKRTAMFLAAAMMSAGVAIAGETGVLELGTDAYYMPCSRINEAFKGIGDPVEGFAIQSSDGLWWMGAVEGINRGAGSFTVTDGKLVLSPQRGRTVATFEGASAEIVMAMRLAFIAMIRDCRAAHGIANPPEPTLKGLRWEGEK